MASNSFGTEVSPDANLANRSFGDESVDLRGDVERAFVAAEARTGFPELEWLDLAAAGGITAAGTVDIICRGSGLLNGGAYATLDIATLTLDAVVPGTGANAFTVEIIDSTAGGLTLDMTSDPNALVIDQGGSASDEDTIATLINNAGEDTFGKIRANSAAGGAMAVAAAAPMTGGLGDDFEASIVGIACPLLHPVGAATAAASMSDTSITLNPPALTSGGAAAGDVGQVRLTCNGARCDLYAVLV
jgi:hypothetical protein